MSLSGIMNGRLWHFLVMLLVATTAVAATRSRTLRDIFCRRGDKAGRIADGTQSVKFFLYTPANPEMPEFIQPGTQDSLIHSHFNRSAPTRYIIHGFLNHVNSKSIAHLQGAYLALGNYNVIVVDWSNGGACNLFYPAAKRRIPQVGEELAEFIGFVRNYTGEEGANEYVIGHSMGAHIAGAAGKHLQDRPLAAIIALDPAGPQFDHSKPGKRLSVSDATYVEVIHTNGGWLGYKKPIGSADFYVNGGRKQPGCGRDLQGRCAHAKAYKLFVESLTAGREFFGVPCTDYKKAAEGKCDMNGQKAKMGGEFVEQKQARGVFYVSTSDDGTDEVDGDTDDETEVDFGEAKLGEDQIYQATFFRTLESSKSDDEDSRNNGNRVALGSTLLALGALNRHLVSLYTVIF